MPSALDSLYGKRTSAPLKKATGAEITEVPLSGGVRVYFEWDDGSEMKADCTAERVHFLSLRSEPERKGLYADLCEKLPKLFKARGVKAFTAAAIDAKAEKALRRRGIWDEDMEWRI